MALFQCGLYSNVAYSRHFGWFDFSKNASILKYFDVVLFDSLTSIAIFKPYVQFYNFLQCITNSPKRWCVTYKATKKNTFIYLNIWFDGHPNIEVRVPKPNVDWYWTCTITMNGILPKYRYFSTKSVAPIGNKAKFLSWYGLFISAGLSYAFRQENSTKGQKRIEAICHQWWSWGVLNCTFTKVKLGALYAFCAL